MSKINIVVEREDEHHHSAKITDESGTVIQSIHRIKKAATAIGTLVWGHKKLFNIRETPFSKEGLAILESQGKHGVYVFINGRKDIKPEYAESFYTALGQLVKRHQEMFNVEVDHKGR